MNTVLAILAAIIGLGSWVYRLVMINRSLKDQVQTERAKSEIKEWADKIKGIEEKVSESERDYEKARDSFINDDSDPPSGAV